MPKNVSSGFKMTKVDPAVVVPSKFQNLEMLNVMLKLGFNYEYSNYAIKKNF